MLSQSQIILFARVAAQYDTPVVWYTERQALVLFVAGDCDRYHKPNQEKVTLSYAELAAALVHSSAEQVLVAEIDKVFDRTCEVCYDIWPVDTDFEYNEESGERTCENCVDNARDNAEYSRDVYAYYGVNRNDF